MFAPVIGAAYTMTTKREAHWSEQTKAQNTEKGMYVGLKQPRGDGERYVTPARAAAKETRQLSTVLNLAFSLELYGVVDTLHFLRSQSSNINDPYLDRLQNSRIFCELERRTIFEQKVWGE